MPTKVPTLDLKTQENPLNQYQTANKPFETWYRDKVLELRKADKEEPAEILAPDRQVITVDRWGAHHFHRVGNYIS